MTIEQRSPVSLGDANSLESTIAACIARMGHFVGEYPIYFHAPAGHDITAAETILDPANLRSYFERAVRDWSPDPSLEDKRAAASRFMRRYVGSVTAAALVPVLYGVSLDVAVPKVRFVMSTHPGQSDMPMGVVLDYPGEVVGASDRPTSWPVRVSHELSLDELRAVAVRNLVVDHLQVAIDRVLGAVHVSPNLLWATVAETVDLLYEGYYERPGPATTDEERARADADKAAILLAPELPGIPGPNPILGYLEWETIEDPWLPRPVHYRKVCCACFVIPSRPIPYCRSCGIIPAEERAKVWRDFTAKQFGS